MEEIVNTYVSFIKEFEAILKHKYSIKENPRYFAGTLFDKKGIIDNYRYQFHGAGCRIEKDDVICEYDSIFSKGNEIDFSLWKITTFVETHPKYKILNLSNEFIEQELYKLIQKEMLSFQIINNCVFQVYQI
ncbi:hypothetical protein B0A61_10910 [Flavobacterium aquatile LMG 4008 = ATCC 11947]|uniref:DUF6896 domain-containing protein n=2 Tax=Flavobacterium aquatile TaxID=245 RepID=A0A095SRF7_9FLAO|nr:hypothetical protein LG45_12990 [Flavobacterium aquatile LMG 4008 = ATCC 11947]OXA66705.1 hypothetical protein B0A61_10910 [Flavobacterium aquatile LMG 4008 = ATCC 11947]